VSSIDIELEKIFSIVNEDSRPEVVMSKILDNFSFQNRGKGLDMNVQGAWAEGITGNGVVVTILDDGLEKDHPDLFKNYVSIFEYFTTFLFF